MFRFNLMHKLFFLALIIAVIDCFLFFKTIKPQISAGENINIDSILSLDNVNIEEPLNVQITATPDKTAYRSYEKISLNIRIISNQDLADALISAAGITSRLGNDYFNQTQNIYLRKNKISEIILSQTLPSCNTCSGLAPGNYKITVEFYYQGKVFSSKEVVLMIRQ